MKKTITDLILAFLILGLTVQVDNLAYLSEQLVGQLNIIFNIEPIDEVVAKNTISLKMKEQLQLIEEIKTFAVESLHLKGKKNYTTFYDQKDQAILKVLTASEPFKLKPYEWYFPIVGDVSYKGFFNFNRALKEEQKLKDQGFDTDLSPTSAWSTLGWFKDPVLSGMLNRSQGRLAELIIHELTHTTLYLPSSVSYNENLASAIGELGAMQFLIQKYGDESDEVRKYKNQLSTANRRSHHYIHGAKLLDSLYESSAFINLPIHLKIKIKAEFIERITVAEDTIYSSINMNNSSQARKTPINNTYFIGYRSYDGQKDSLKNIIDSLFNGKVAAYIHHISFP
ncbi:MAG: hypothetical protein RIQ89_606 [Bacteroidota bacterium]|jgi:predicted aminopeptidase